MVGCLTLMKRRLPFYGKPCKLPTLSLKKFHVCFQLFFLYLVGQGVFALMERVDGFLPALGRLPARNLFLSFKE